MRVGALDPYQLGLVHGWHEKLAAEPIRSVVGPLNVHLLAYGSLIQSGLERVNLIKPNDVELPDPGPALRNRIKVEDGTSWGLAYLVLSTLLARRSHRAGSPLAKEQGRLHAFLASLLSAPHRGVSVIWFGPPPPRYVLERHLQPAAVIPLATLFDTMEGTHASVPVPHVHVMASDVAIAQQIINSAAYDKYVTAHAALHDPRCPVAQASRFIADATNRLEKRNQRVLRVKRIPLWVVTGAVSVVEAIAGKLPGAIADMVLKVLHPHISPDERIVIYDCSKTGKAIVTV